MKIQFFVCPQTILVLQSVPVIPDKSLLQGRLISGLLSQQDGTITQVHFFHNYNCVVVLQYMENVALIDVIVTL